MNKMEEDNEENVISFAEAKNKLATAGKEPPNPYGQWLKDKPIGSVFLVKHKRNLEFALGLFTVLDKTERSVLLGNPSLGPNQPSIRTYVDPIAFCNNYSLYEDLGTIVTEDTIENNAIEEDYKDTINTIDT